MAYFGGFASVTGHPLKSSENNYVTVTELLDLLIKKSIFPLLFIYNIYIAKT